MTTPGSPDSSRHAPASSLFTTAPQPIGRSHAHRPPPPVEPEIDDLGEIVDPFAAVRPPVQALPRRSGAVDNGAAGLARVDLPGAGIALTHPETGGAVALTHDGLPMVLDAFAVATRAVLVLIGSIEPAKHIAKTAIDVSIERDSSAALDIVVPRAVDLVLRRAAYLVAAGAGPKVVDDYAARLELWRRLASRTGLEPAAIVLTLAPFPLETVAMILRVTPAEIAGCLDRWFSGEDPVVDRSPELVPRTAPVRPSAAPAGRVGPDGVVWPQPVPRELLHTLPPPPLAALSAPAQPAGTPGPAGPPPEEHTTRTEPVLLTPPVPIGRARRRPNRWRRRPRPRTA